jgi:hydrogenase nickel incorporation protein HypA/HybF
VVDPFLETHCIDASVVPVEVLQWVVDSLCDLSGISRRGDHMHEMGIALEIYRHCREQAREHNASRIEAVRVAVGELSTIEPELLKFAWEAVVAEGPDQKSALDVVWRPCSQVCTGCGQSAGRAEGSWLRVCDQCGSPLDVSGGLELDIVEITLEIEEEAEVG